MIATKNCMFANNVAMNLILKIFYFFVVGCGTLLILFTHK